MAAIIPPFLRLVNMAHWMKYCTVAKSMGRSRPIWTSVVVCARVACALRPVQSIPVAIFLNIQTTFFFFQPFLNRLDRTGPVVLGRAPACKGVYGVVRLTNFIRPGKLFSDQWSNWRRWTFGLFLSPAGSPLSLSLSLALSFSLA